MDQLNSDLLRLFVAVAETGSVTEGAGRIHRSQSAASLQLRKLEDIVGRPVFARHGRGVTLTDAGARLLPVARDVIERLDTTLRALTSDDLRGTLRLGIPDDQGQRILARIVAAFAQSHPMVDLDVTCALSAGFPEALARGRLDLAIYEVAEVPPGLSVLRRDRTAWMMSPHHDLLARDPIPVALFDRDCWWRDAALASLAAMNRRFHIVYSSASVAGVAAAIEAGIAVGLLAQGDAVRGLRPLGADDGFGETPMSCLVLGVRPGDETLAIQAMRRAVEGAFATPEQGAPRL